MPHRFILAFAIQLTLSAGIATWAVLRFVDDTTSAIEFAFLSAANLVLGAILGFSVASSIQLAKLFGLVGVSAVLLSGMLVLSLGYLTWWPALGTVGIGAGMALKQRRIHATGAV